MALTKYSAFLKRARKSPAYWARIALRDFTEELIAKLGDKPRSALAEAAGVSPAYITKVLRGGENLTIETMAKLALAVGCKVRLHISDLDHDTVWRDVYTNVNYKEADIPPAPRMDVTVSLSSGSARPNNQTARAFGIAR